MTRDNVHIAFADGKMESEYKKLIGSAHPEDRRLHSVLTSVRTALAKYWRRGDEITRTSLGVIYTRLYQVDNVWRLEVPPHGTVLFSVHSREIRIVDVL